MSDKIDPVDPLFAAGYNSRQKDVDWLRAEVARLTHLHNLDHSLADQREAEIKRLRAECNLWRERFHRAHVSRGEWLKVCPLCEPV